MLAVPCHLILAFVSPPVLPQVEVSVKHAADQHRYQMYGEFFLSFENQRSFVRCFVRSNVGMLVLDYSLLDTFTPWLGLAVREETLPH